MEVGTNFLLIVQFYLIFFFIVSCASNPCNLTTGFDATNGYCCIDVPPNYTDSVCTCPNNVPPVINGPCRKNLKKKLIIQYN